VVPQAAAAAVAVDTETLRPALSPAVACMRAAGAVVVVAVAVVVVVAVDSLECRTAGSSLSGRRSPVAGGGGLAKEPGKYRRMTFAG
jgi:hypothetical protein